MLRIFARIVLSTLNVSRETFSVRFCEKKNDERDSVEGKHQPQPDGKLEIGV